MKTTKKTAYLLMMIFIVTLTSACEKIIKVSTNKDLVEYEISCDQPIDSIYAEGFTDIIVTHGSPKVTLSTYPMIRDNITVTVKNNRLIVWSADDMTKQNGMTVLGGLKAIVKVTTPNLANCVTYGSGDINIQGIEESDSLNIKSYGSGDIELINLSGKLLDIESNGSGDVTLTNIQFDDIATSNSGSGNLNAKGFTFSNLSISSSGSGDIFASGIKGGCIIGVAGGSGDITLSGICKSCNFVAGGSGDVNTHKLKITK